MLRKFSRSGHYLQILLILAVSFLYLFSPHPGFEVQAFSENAAPLGRWLTGILPENDMAIRIASLTLILMNAAGFNMILNHHDLTPRQSLFTTLIASVFFLFTGQAVAIIAPLTALLLLLFSLHSAMKLYAESYPYTLVLNASICVAIASMIYPLAILFAFFYLDGILHSTGQFMARMGHLVDRIDSPIYLPCFLVFLERSSEHSLK